MAIGDFELQDAIVADDQTATAAIPLQTRLGILEALELRHTGGSFQFTARRVLSTHPDHWWGMARAIPIEPYTQQVRVIVRMTTQDVAAVDVRARIGVATSDVARVAANVTSSVELVVPLSVSREQRVEVLSIEWQSQRGDVIATTVSVESPEPGQVTVDPRTAVQGVAGPSNTAVHVLLEPDTGTENWTGDAGLYEGMPRLYVGAARVGFGFDVANCYVWPQDTPGAASPGWGSILFTSYELGTFTLLGIAWSCEGRIGSPVPEASAFAIGSYMRSSDVLAMHAAAAQAYDARPWVWVPSQGEYPGFTGTQGVAIGDRGLCHWSYRQDAIAIEIAALVGAPFEAVEGRPLTLQVFDSDGTELEDETIGLITIPQPVRREGPATDGTLWAATRYSVWGGGDLLYAGPSPPDWQRLTMVRATVMLDTLTGLTQRDDPYLLRVLVSLGATGRGRAYMHGVTIWERTRTSDSP